MDENHDFFVTCPAFFFRFLYVAVGFLGCCATLLSRGSWSYTVIIYTLTFIGIAASCRQRGLAVMAVFFSPYSGWILVMNDVTKAVSLMPCSIVTRFITVLYFKDDGGRKYGIVFLGGWFERYNYRRLRFLLKVSTLS
jgi:hypothetical protein